MNETTGRPSVFTPRGYISIADAIQRRLKISRRGIAGITQDHWNGSAWKAIRTLLYSGSINSSILKNDGKLLPVLSTFWGSRDAIELGPNSDRVSSSQNDEANGVYYIKEDDFIREVEQSIRPLPNSVMPQNLLFVSQTDDEGNSLGISYMSITEAIEAIIEQNRAYSEEDLGNDISYYIDKARIMFESGAINTFHRDDSGRIRMLNPNDWQANGIIVKRISKKSSFGTIRKASEAWWNILEVYTDSGPKGGELIVLRDDVLNVIRGKATAGETRRVGERSTESASVSNNNVPRVGRPPKYDVETFLLEAFKIIHVGDPSPKSLEELCERTLSAYKAAKKKQGFPMIDIPSETWMKDRLRQLYKWARDRNSDTDF